MAKAYIFGAGGHARVIASFLDVAPVFVVQSLEGQAALPASMMSEDDYFRELPLGDAYLGIGANAARELCASRLRAAKVNLPPCIAPTAFVARDAEIESGAVIGAGAVIGSRALIGRDTIVNTLSSVDHDCILGALSQVTVGVTFGGGVPTPNPTFKALAGLAGDLKGAVVMGHSQSGSFPLEAALINPAAMKGLVLVEPGSFRTDFFTRSLKFSDPIADYGQTLRSSRNADLSGLPDPAIVARAIADAAERPDQPLRLMIGADAVEVATGKLRLLSEAIEAAQR